MDEQLAAARTELLMQDRRLKEAGERERGLKEWIAKGGGGEGITDEEVRGDWKRLVGGVENWVVSSWRKVEVGG
jgi:hypothetical protein